ncbi:MAG: hypothetical protein O2809_08875 [Proteobacteria bacterium]|nr:hypothetical protein [Pseudomonadota bacterium]
MRYKGKKFWSYTLSIAFTTALILTAGCSQKSPTSQQIDQLSLQSTMAIPSTVKPNSEVLLNFKLDDETKALQIGAVGNTGYQYQISKITLNGLKLSTQSADDSCINADGSYASFDGNTGCELALTADVASTATTASLEIVLNSGQVIDKTINFTVENPLYPTLGRLLVNGLNPNTNTIFTHNDFGVFVFNLNAFALNNLVLSDNQNKPVGSLKELASYTMGFIKPNTAFNHPPLLNASNTTNNILYLDAANLANTIQVTEVLAQNPYPQYQQNLYIQKPNQDYKLSLTPVTDMTINTASLVLPQDVNIKGNNPFVNGATLNKGSTYTLTLNAQQDAYIANQKAPKLLISYTDSDKSTHYIQDNM